MPLRDITEVTRWRTWDGTLFESERDAVRYEIFAACASIDGIAEQESNSPDPSQITLLRKRVAELQSLLDHLDYIEGRGPSRVTIVQPVGNCDGSKLYAYDASKEDGRGEPLPERCPGCRACC